MKLDEILDRNDPEYLRRIKAATDTISKQYGPGPLSAPGKDQANAAFKAKREKMERTVAEIAKKYTGEQFEAFRSEVLVRIPHSEIQNVIDLQWAFDTYNPDRKKTAHKAWDDYGKTRAAGPSADPQGTVFGRGPTGDRNWTGD